MTSLSINGRSYDVDVEPDTPLLWVLRDTIGLTGTRYGCGIAQCGACTVHIDDAPVRSCSMPIASITAGAKITTIEGLAQNGTLHPVQQAWIDHDVPQCGYCQSGMIMAVVALLKDRPKPTDADIDDAITNICRCGKEMLRQGLRRPQSESMRSIRRRSSLTQPWSRRTARRT